MMQIMSDEHKARVLIVEDDEALLEAISDILEGAGYEVVRATNGAEGLRKLAEQKPDVVVSDIVMPEMDGYEFLRATRQLSHGVTIPFLFLTARTAKADVRLAKQIGVEDFLTKPFEPEDLIVAIENALRRSTVMRSERDGYLSEMQRRILSMLQEEFRTPLSLILGYAELLQEVPDSELNGQLVRDYLNGILAGGQRLKRLIENFLLLARLESSRAIERPVQPFSAIKALRAVQRKYQDAARKAGLELVLLDTNCEAKANADINLVVEALSRLVDNAIRFSRPESRRVTLRLEKRNGGVAFIVEDEGQGIPRGELPYLFDAFYQAERQKYERQGSGLSLALVREIARRCGGQVSVESQQGVGSTFTIWLPAQVNTEGSSPQQG